MTLHRRRPLGYARKGTRIGGSRFSDPQDKRLLNLWRRLKREFAKNPDCFNKRWTDYPTFRKDLRFKAPEDKVFVRIDTERPWGPDNYKWITRHELRRDSGHARLSEEVAEDICERLMRAETIQSIAKHHGVSTKTVWAIRRRRTWKDVSARVIARRQRVKALL